jgi:hypothetical protein
MTPPLEVTRLDHLFFHRYCLQVSLERSPITLITSPLAKLLKEGWLIDSYHVYVVFKRWNLSLNRIASAHVADQHTNVLFVLHQNQYLRSLVLGSPVHSQRTLRIDKIQQL